MSSIADSAGYRCWAILLSASALLFTGTVANAELTFSLTDITGWNQTQLDTLPHFQRWVPYAPAGAPTGYVAQAHNTNGQTVGERSSTYGPLSAVVTDTPTIENINPYGTYYWQYLYWDGTDYHFQNGRVSFTHANDINNNGIAVGDSTLTGNGESSYGYTSHAISYDSTTDSKTDLTPIASKAGANAVNDAGMVVGWADTGTGTRAFVYYPNGAYETLDTFASTTQANAINGNGTIVGNSTTVNYNGVSTLYRRHPFASIDGTTITDLGLPTQNSVDEGTVNDVNNALWAVGNTWRNDQSWEHFAAIWQYDAGAWSVTDLNELIDGDYILENALAITEQGEIIATGRLDGTDTYGSHLFLLSPSEAPVPLSMTRTTPTLTGDINQDGFVGLTDLDVILNNWNMAVPDADPSADITGEGFVGLSDLDVVLSQWNTGTPPTSSDAVPEPASLLLFEAGCALAITRRT